jgi:Cdc6-like AAA superfamily ATPase
MRSYMAEGTAKGGGGYDDNALMLVARKVANCSGDVRRCLELCRRQARRSAGGGAGRLPRLQLAAAAGPQ